jgi:predicted PhzF superfamily epimerase YddE/YHI9
MSQVIHQVDAFTDRPFSGNPAAVLILSAPADAEWMQLVAREMNLSETAFLSPRDDGSFGLRWFTPTVEVDLCGHATLASAHVLWETGRLHPEAEVRFDTQSGRLVARRAGSWIEMDFPATPDQPSAAPAGLSAALGAEPRYVGRSRFDTLVELGSEAEVRELRPDFGRLKQIPRGVIVTARSSGGEFDFVSRFFAPAAGIDEDPVTGSAHCCLAPYWAKKLGKKELVGYQASARGGVVRVRDAGPRVILSGQAVSVLRAELL